MAASPLDINCTSNCKGYYSYNLGDWHIIALNSEIAHGAGSPGALKLTDEHREGGYYAPAGW